MSLTKIDSSNIFHKDVIGNVRTAQEDSHGIATLTPNGDVFVVCDGMGGHVGGKQASSIAVKSIIDYLKKEKYPQPLQALNEALQFANMQILGYANNHPELKGMGTTACILMLQDSEAYIAHVGDSRIYLYLGKEKQLHRITKDHSFVQTLVDAGQITDEEAENHPNKNRILKALGIKSDLKPSFDSLKPKNGDVFLICSDGLSGMISDSTITNILTQDLSISIKGDNLINLALKAGGVDNITLELIQITNSPNSKSIFQSYNPTSQVQNPPKNIPISPTKVENPPVVESSCRISSLLKRIVIISCIIIFGIAIVCGSIFIHKKWKITKEIERFEQLVSKNEKEITNLNSKINEDSLKCEELNQRIKQKTELLLNSTQNKELKTSITIEQQLLDYKSNDLEKNKRSRTEYNLKLALLKDSLNKLLQ